MHLLRTKLELKQTLGPLHQVLASSIPALRIRSAARVAVANLKLRTGEYSHSLHYTLDLNGTLPGLGDFLMDLVLARAIATLDTTLRLDPHFLGTPANIQTIESSGISSSERIADFRRIIELNHLSLVPCPHALEGASRNDCEDIQKTIGWRKAREGFLSAGNVYLVNLIADRFGVDPSTFFEWKPRGTYVGIHIRGTAHNSDRNPAEDTSRNDIEDLAEMFPSHEIRVFSNPAPQYLSQLIYSLRLAGRNVTMQRSGSFPEAISEILGSDYWFQRKGGGASVPVLYSKMPYLMISSDYAAKSLFGITGSQFGNWVGANQHFLTSILSAERRRLSGIALDMGHGPTL